MKKILSSILAAAMIVGAVLSAFPAVVSAADAEPLYTWDAGTSIREQIGVASAGSTENQTTTAFNTCGGVWSFYSFYGWGYGGLHGHKYETNPAAFCYLYGRNDTNGSSAASEFNKDHVAVYSTGGFEVSSVYNDLDVGKPTTLTFKAPANGKYVIVPKAINDAGTLLSATKAAWQFDVYSGDANAVEFNQTVVVEGGATGTWESMEVELSAGETIVFSFALQTNVDMGGAKFRANFAIDLVEEFGTLVEVQPGIYNDAVTYKPWESVKNLANLIGTEGYVAGSPMVGEPIIPSSSML